MKLTVLAVALVLACVFVTTAEARPKHRAHGVGQIVAHPAGCPARAFCGCGAAVRIFGKPIRNLWLARNWIHVGWPAHGPHVGAVVVWARGKRSGHVGIITGKTARGWIVKSGNDGNAVRERVRSVSNAIAFRWP